MSVFTVGPKNPLAPCFFKTFSGLADSSLGKLKHLKESASPFALSLRNRIFQFLALLGLLEAKITSEDDFYGLKSHCMSGPNTNIQTIETVRIDDLPFWI